MTLDVGLSVDSPLIKVEESIANINDGITSADSSAAIGIASIVLYTTSRS